jgi:DnaJ-class molecular chaperone
MEMLYFKVYKDCEKCGGIGTYAVPSMVETNTFLPHFCYDCNGSGKVEKFISGEQLMKYFDSWKGKT